MADIAYKNAVIRQQELLKELREIEEFLRMFDKFSDTKREQSVSSVTPESVSIEIPAAQMSFESHPPSVHVTRRGLPRDKLAGIMERVLIENGRPLVRSALVEHLKERNVPIGGSDPAKNLGTTLWRLKDKFVNLSGYGYWPRGVDCPAVGYVASLGEIVETVKTSAPVGPPPPAPGIQSKASPPAIPMPGTEKLP